MISYLLRRLASAVIVVIGVMMVTFLMLHVISPSPARAVLGIRASPAAIAAFNHAHGFDRSVGRQFLTYANQTIHFNFGYSYKLNQSVTDLFKSNAGRSILLSGVSVFLAVLIAMPLGIVQAVKRNSVLDYTAPATSFTLYSMPLFFLSLMLIDFFAIRHQIFPAFASDSTTLWGVIKDPRSMVLPVASLVVALRRRRTRDICGPRRWTTSRRTTSRWRGQRAVRAGRAVPSPGAATPAFRW